MISCYRGSAALCRVRPSVRKHKADDVVSIKIDEINVTTDGKFPRARTRPGDRECMLERAMLRIGQLSSVGGVIDRHKPWRTVDGAISMLNHRYNVGRRHGGSQDYSWGMEKSR